MRIRFITLYFWPEAGAAQSRILDEARSLVERGHEVTVLTGFPNYPDGVVPEDYKKHFFMREKKDGINIIRLPHYIAPNEGTLKRLLIHLTFSFSATIYSLLMRHDDVVYLESPPLFNGFAAILTKWLRGIPYLFDLADLWPQIAIELGFLKNKIVIGLISRMEELFYRQSYKVLSKSQGWYDILIERGLSQDKITVLTNGADLEKFHPNTEPDEEINSYRRDDNMLVVYAGTHGLIYALDYLLKAAKTMEDEPIDFLFVGKGADKSRLLKIADDLGLDNVNFLPAVPKERMPGVFRAADLTVISLRDLPVCRTILPMKCFEIMATGTPILLAVKGEIAVHIEKAGCGKTIEPENTEAMVAGLRYFMQMSSDERVAMGLRGRAYACENFSREKITDRLEQYMLEAIGQ